MQGWAVSGRDGQDSAKQGATVRAVLDSPWAGRIGQDQGRIQRGGSGAWSPSPMTRGAPAPKAQKRQYPSFFANNNQRAALRANRAQSMAGG